MGNIGRCGCWGSSLPPSTPKSGKQGCICANTYMNLCSKGPEPCGDTFELDLTDYVENGINDSESYELVRYSGDGFADGTVGLTPEGLLTLTTEGVSGERYFVEYRAYTEYEGIVYATNGYVKLCFKDMCKGVDCPDGQECENCTGNCVDTVVDLES